MEMGPKVFVFLSLSALSSFSRGNQCPIQEPIFGKALKDYTFKTLPGRSHFDCLYHCHYEVKCQSYNYDMKDKICEMNNRTKEAKPLNFVTDPARFYMRRGTQRVTLGSTPALPAESCAEIKANEARVMASGNFWLDPEGTGEVVLVYCDMNTGVADFCNQHRCQNGASCINGLVNYTCLCRGLWAGVYCDTAVSDDKKNFDVTVETADVWLAGTDAQLYLELIGNDGRKSGETKVGTEDGSNDDFETGQTDNFMVVFEDVGIIDKLKIELKNPEQHWYAGWTMEKITIRDLSRQKTYTFSGPLDVDPGIPHTLSATHE